MGLPQLWAASLSDHLPPDTMRKKTTVIKSAAFYVISGY